MKILELRFKNLNSLYGEWVIDFTDAEYVSNGIFALTGPTGAGKSTILDAICLALYGATPRLGRITKSGNEIMSRQTGECYAEVLFESQAGHFRCHWEQRCARKKAGSKLQDPEHQIIDFVTGKPIETKKSLVAGIIEEKTGMDFDRFTRSILLAQGGFDTFLKADIEQKSKILEQITGTEIYSEISRSVHERQRNEREKLNLLQAEISGIVILDPEQEKEIQQDLEAKQKQDTDLASNLNNTGKAITWLTTIDDLKKEIQSFTDVAAKLQSKIEAFKPERDNLERAMKVASLDGIYATLIALRNQQLDDKSALKDEEVDFPELEASTNTQIESLKAAEQYTQKAKEELKSTAPLIQKIRSLDQKLAEQAKAISELAESCTKEAGKIHTDKQAQEKKQEKRSEAEKTLVTVEEYLKEHAQDEWLIGGLTGIEEQFGNLLVRQQEIIEKEDDLKGAEIAMVEAIKKLNGSTKQCAIRKQELEGATKTLQQGQDALIKLLGDRSLREYRTEKETLLREMAYIRKIEELDDYRTKLEDNKPCPLCGSKEHPYAEGNVPVPDEIEKKIEALTKLITKAEELENANKKLKEAEVDAYKKQIESITFETNATNNKRAVEKNLEELKDGLQILQSRSDELKQAVSHKLQPLGADGIPEFQVSSLLKSLKSRLNAWMEKVGEKAEIANEVADIDSEMRRLDAVIETQSLALTEKQENIERVKKEHVTGMDERKKLYDDKKPDDEESRLNNAIVDAEEAENKARSLNTQIQKKLTAAITHVESLRKRIGQREPGLKKEETDFLAALETTGFLDEQQFIEAMLTNEEREILSSRANKLNNDQTELKARLKDRATSLATETAKKVTDKTLEELELQFKEHEQFLKALSETITGLKHKQSENAVAKERIEEKQTTIKAQKKECYRWEKLHGLIGSADGKKYRNFAQGLTFELMVSHANRQLEKMTERYLLIRNEEQPLELSVVDDYQAGEIRSTKNLSGGESFIVSLTLALGLSKMASRKVRVDSLFLDEGFGTLDEETLEIALETLSGLQQDGKLIGVISHIPALKERVSTQIRIMPVSNGKSRIEGPGCSKTVDA